MDETNDSKLCAACRVDVRNAARMKDVQGRYVCLACADRLRQALIQKRHARLQAESPGETIGVDSTAYAEVLDDLIVTQSAAPDRLTICFKCKQDMPNDAPVCRVCGFDIRESRVRAPGVIEALADIGIRPPRFLLRRKPLTRLGLLYIVLFGLLPILDAFLMRRFYLISMGGAVILLSSIGVWLYAMMGRYPMHRTRGSRVRLAIIWTLLFPLTALRAMVLTLSEGRDMFMRTLSWANLVALLFFAVAVGVDQYLYAKELAG